MKVSKIHIKNWRQFKELDLDLTYPLGHPKAGLPLDKICFIGQSGTGKTTLLWQILKLLASWKDGSQEYKLGAIYEDNEAPSAYAMEDQVVYVEKRPGYLQFHQKDNKGELAIVSQFRNAELIRTTNNPAISLGHIFGAEKLVYFPAELVGLFAKIRIPTFEEAYKKLRDGHIAEPFFIVDEENTPVLWRQFYEKVIRYNSEEAEYSRELLRAKNVDDADLRTRFEAWKKENPNPLEDIATLALDKLLERLFLKVNTNQSLKDTAMLECESLATGEKISFEELSTGTRQLILTGLPLYTLNLQDSIVMIDEPETSLYPNMQRDIVSYYTSFGQGNQYLFATHSPIIAAQFEPWELVELDFDKEGFATQRKYYEGERHVDNYMLDPRYLRWDSVLDKLFDVTERGGEERMGALMTASRLEKQLQNMKAEGQNNTEGFKEKYKHYKELAQKLGWQLTN